MVNREMVTVSPRRSQVTDGEPRTEGGSIATDSSVQTDVQMDPTSIYGGPSPETRALALAVAAAADTKKAEDVVILEVSQTLGIADYFVICTASSRKHAQVVAEYCHEVAAQQGFARPLEGVREASWVCGDFGDVVLHVFIEETRKFYDLESLWADAPRLEFTPAQPLHGVNSPSAHSPLPPSAPALASPAPPLA